MNRLQRINYTYPHMLYQGIGQLAALLQETAEDSEEGGKQVLNALSALNDTLTHGVRGLRLCACCCCEQSAPYCLLFHPDHPFCFVCKMSYAGF